MRRLAYSGRLLGQFVGFARDTKSYWILPVIVALGLAAFMTFGIQGAAPLIYAFF
jgi:hypothetical protein